MADRIPNPPAFPHTGEGLGRECATDGMDMRDYFAAKAMQAHIAGLGPTAMTPDAFNRLVAALSYASADAMLAERAK